MVYETKTFGAWHVEDESFQMKILDYPFILSFEFDIFSDFRKDLSRVSNDLKVLPEFLWDFENIRIYSTEKEDMIYIIFKDLSALSVGFTEEDFSSFHDDVMNFNPRMMLEIRHELPENVVYSVRDKYLIIKKDKKVVVKWPIFDEDEYYSHVHPGYPARYKVPKWKVSG